MAKQQQKSTGKQPASKASTSKPKSFDFKKVKRDKPTTKSGGRSGGGFSGQSKPTSSRVHPATFQSGDREGQETGAHLFVFNPRYGLNDTMTKAVEAHSMGKDTVSSFKKELSGFTIKVHAPKQVEKMQDALRELDDALPETVDMNGLEAPEITVVTMSNLDLPGSGDREEQEGIDAIMLEGYTYPLYKVLRKLKYDFVRGVHGKEGVNKWVRVIGDKESPTSLVREVTEMLLEHGWEVDEAAGDAADWDDDEE